MVLAVIALTVATVIAYSFLGAQSTSIGIARNVSNHSEARYIAESGLDLAIAYVTGGADWRTEKPHGTWVADEAFAGGTYTIVGEDGEDLDRDGIISQPSEGDGDLTDDASDPLTLTVTGKFNNRTHVARATLRANNLPFLVNGNFEDSLNDGNDDPDPGWDVDEGRKLTIVDTSTGQVKDGDYALWFETAGNAYTAYQEMTGLAPGETYTLTAYLHMLLIEGHNKNSDPLFRISIGETETDTPLVEHVQTEVTTDWLEVTLHVIAPDNGAIWVKANYEDVKYGSLYLDDITFEDSQGNSGGGAGYSVDW
jgi:hypothetical protein